MRPLHASAVLALAAAAQLMAACNTATPYDKPLTPVLVTEARRQPAGRLLRYSAVVEPTSRVDVAFRVGGYVVDLAREGGRSVQDGDRVAAGTVLASVRAADYDARVGQGQAAVAEAEAAHGAATLALARAETLFASRSLTRPEVEQARAQVAAIDAKLAGGRALVREAELARGDADLRAPIAGVILKRHVEVGSLVGPGTPGFSLADTRTVKVVIGVPDTMLQRFPAGDTAGVQFEAVPDRRFEGRITKVSPAADARSRLFDVELMLPNGDGALRPGMVATVTIDDAGAAADADALTLPLSAIVRNPGEDGEYAVFVLQDAADGPVARVRKVRLGGLVGNEIAVTDGLKEGERVIVRGATIVADGERVNATR